MQEDSYENMARKKAIWKLYNGNFSSDSKYFNNSSMHPSDNEVEIRITISVGVHTIASVWYGEIRNITPAKNAIELTCILINAFVICFVNRYTRNAFNMWRTSEVPIQP